MTQQEVWLRLSAVKGLTAIQLGDLADRLVAENTVSAARLRYFGLDDQQVNAYFHPGTLDIPAALAWLERENHHLIPWTSPDYPPLLKHIASPPRVLYVQGAPAVLATPQLAIVGSRHCSYYGEHWTRFFAAGLVNCGFTVTSGLAIGIDGICHQATLEAVAKPLRFSAAGCNTSILVAIGRWRIALCSRGARWFPNCPSTQPRCLIIFHDEIALSAE